MLENPFDNFATLKIIPHATKMYPNSSVIITRRNKYAEFLEVVKPPCKLP